MGQTSGKCCQIKGRIQVQELQAQVNTEGWNLTFRYL